MSPIHIQPLLLVEGDTAHLEWSSLDRNALLKLLKLMFWIFLTLKLPEGIFKLNLKVLLYYLKALVQFDESLPGPFNQVSTLRSVFKVGATRSSYKSFLNPADLANEVNWPPFFDEIVEIW